MLGFSAALLIKRNPHFVEKEITDFDTQLSFKEGIKNKIFWTLFVMVFCSDCPLFMISQTWKTIGLQVGEIDDRTLTFIGSLGSIANGFSRVFLGPI